MRHLHFCTYFDLNYLPYAKLLSKSLFKYNKSITLFIVCMDKEVLNILNREPILNSVVYSHNELINFKPRLKKIKNERSKAEYFFTCSAQVCDFVFDKNPDIKLLNYVDCDLYFYNSLKPLFAELGNASVGIIEHKFHWLNKSKRKYGRFNVGWISFRNDKVGRQCVSDWATQCMDWCYQKLEYGKYADQKYLDQWPKKYPGLKILKHKGANLAIWNLKNYKLNFTKGLILIDNQPLLFYHFAGLRQLDAKTFKTNLSSYYISLKGVLLNNIYIPYINQLLEIMDKTNVKFIKEMKHTNLVSLIRKFVAKLKQLVFKDIIQV